MIILYVLVAMLITLPVVTPGYYRLKNLPGAALCFALAVAAWFLGKALPLAGGAVLAILLGMLLANFCRLPARFSPGINISGKRVLQGAIVLFGFQMDLSQVLSLGGSALILIALTIVTALAIALLLGKALGATENERILIGMGTAICGGSAIAAVAPVIKAGEREVATAISTIFLFNVAAVFLFPLVGHLLHMSDLRFGMWAGAAINDTSSVVAAAYSYSDAAGHTATVVKLTRTLMIIPITFVLALRQSKQESGAGNFSLLRSFPWFVAGFAAACLLNTAGLVPAAWAAFWGQMGKFSIVAAMAAIGLNTRLGELIRQGRRSLLLGGCCSLAVAVLSLVAQRLLQMI